MAAALLAAIAVLGRAAIAGAQASHAAPAPAVEPARDAREILLEARDYRSWEKFPQYAQGAAFSKGHGQTYVVAWRNAVAAAAAKGGGPFPDGSVLVKESRPQPDAAPAALAVMAKRRGAWYWIRATPDWKVLTRDGEPVAGPDVKGCVGCHTAAERDMVFSR